MVYECIDSGEGCEAQAGNTIGTIAKSRVVCRLYIDITLTGNLNAMGSATSTDEELKRKRRTRKLTLQIQQARRQHFRRPNQYHTNTESGSSGIV